MSSKPSRKELTHERIVDAAARALRRQGYQGVGVADVMKDAGLTHGGFYAHFESRDAMLAEAVARAGREGEAVVRQDMDARMAQGASAFRALVEAYLSDLHLRAVEGGCPIAALASEMCRQNEVLREASGERVKAFVKIVQQVLPSGTPNEEAVVIVSTLVGAIQLARALGDNRSGKAILKTTRQALIDRYEPMTQAGTITPAH